MIEFTKSYKTQDGQVFGSIEEAQVHEIASIFGKGCFATPKDAAGVVLNNKAILIDILTTTATSKPKARSVHGGTKNRNKRTIVTDAKTSTTSVLNSVSDSATTV